MFSRLLETRAIMKVGQITRLNSFACFYDPLIAVGIVCAQFQVVTDRSGCFSNIFLDFHKGCRGRERREEYRFFSLRNLSVARASVFLAPKLQFGWWRVILAQRWRGSVSHVTSTLRWNSNQSLPDDDLARRITTCSTELTAIIRIHHS